MIRSETMSSEETRSPRPETPPLPPAEPPEDVAETSEDDGPNRSRELKSLLALSKEANLDTNIAHKRKEKARRPSSAKFFPVTAENELEDGDRSEDGHRQPQQQHRGGGRSASASPRKRPRLDSSGSHESAGDKAKAFATLKVFKENKDMFCWRCHRDGVNVACETCPRSYHSRCLKQSIPDAEKWLCPECASIMTAESTHNRSLKDVPLGHLCNLLKFALNRMMQCHGSQPFLHPVNEAEFPEYKRYIIYPMDLTKIEKNIKSNLYGSTQAFEADSKWLLHNSIIFNSYQSKLTSAAKNIIKVCRQEMAEIENCSNCYLNANTKKDTWFIEVCPKPHLPVWAKLKGFPYWPAKVLSVTSAGMVDVRFFGAHDRAWIPHRDCYLFSEKDPNTFKQKRHDIEQCIEELRMYVENLKSVFGEFRYAPYRVLFDPTDYELQLKMFLPKYKRPKSEKRRAIAVDADGVEEEEEEVKKSTKEEEEEEEAKDEEKADATVEEEKKLNDDDTDDDDDADDDNDKKLDSDNDDDNKKLDGDDDGNRDDEKKLDSTDSNDDDEKKLDGNATNDDEKKLEDDKKSDERVEKNSEEEGEERNDDVEEEEDEDDEVEEGEDTQAPTDVSVDKEPPRGVPRMRGGMHASSGRLKVLPRRRSEPALRNSSGERRDSDDQSSTSDDSGRRPSGAASAASRRKSVSAATTTTTAAPSPPPKRGGAVVQVAIDGNAEVTISPKSKMSETLMKRLSEATTTTTTDEKGPAEESTEESRDAEPMEQLRNDRKKLFSIIHSSLNSSKGQKPASGDAEGERPAKKRRLSSPDSSTGLKASAASKPFPLPHVVPQDEIKSEPETDEGDEPEVEEEEEEEEANEDDEAEEEEEDVDSDLEAKKRYLSALNISERSLAEAATAKKQRPEIRTRAKAEERRERFKVVDNMTKVIDEVAVNYDCVVRRQGEPPTPKEPVEGEIQVKSFAKLKTPENQQRARKSFPTPPYVGGKGVASTAKKEAVATRKSGAAVGTPVKIAVTVNGKVGGAPAPTTTAGEASSKTADGPVTTMQHVILLPAPSIGYSSNVANQMLGVMPKIQQAPQTSLPTLTPGAGASTSVLKFSQFVPNTKASQNYIPQQQDDVVVVGPATTRKPSTPVPSAPASAKSTPVAPPSASPSVNGTSNNVESHGDEFAIIRALVPENVNRALTELLVRPPPKLRPRPPGMLSERFEQGVPSSAGDVAAKVNAIAHRMTDYFRGMLVETLEEFGKESNPEARIARLQLELETMRHKHSTELAEVRRTVCSILKDVQESIALEKEKAVEEARAACEAETIRRVELAKSKQWCTMCSKEAQFYCCWNTSYCDYPCQQKHWPQHMGKCTQSTEKAGGASAPPPATTATATVPLVRTQSQPIILRPTLPPKNAVGRILGKPTRIYMNKSVGPGTAKSFKTFTSGNSHITVIETSTGSYELFSSNGLVAGKTMTAAAPKTVTTLSPSSTTTGSSQTVENNGPKV